MFGVVGTRAVQARHLAKRFFASLSDERPTLADDQWVRQQLLEGEEELWSRMSASDQRHGVQVAKDVLDVLPDADRPVLAAAVLHDVGKLVCGYGTYKRVGATVFWGAVPARFRSQLAFGWSSDHPPGLRRRLGEYRIHPELGRDLLVEAGSDPFTAAWAAQHHTPVDKWTVNHSLGLVLKECDDD